MLTVEFSTKRLNVHKTASTWGRHSRYSLGLEHSAVVLPLDEGALGQNTCLTGADLVLKTMPECVMKVSSSYKEISYKKLKS